MTYQETIDYLYSALPMFQRLGPVAYKVDLGNTIELVKAIGDPHTKFKSIHVAGTNGKGSVSHMLASVLQEAGYKVGLYTSPHLKSFTERIRVNGAPIEEAAVVDFVERIRPVIEKIEPSFFEITVAMAFDYFANQQVDIAVVEVGLGGRLDSTNIITPEVSVITNIGWDHQALLGDTLPKIAFEKAGIIKKGVPVVVSQKQSEVAKVFERKAAAEQTSVTFASDMYRLEQASPDRFNVFWYNEIVHEGLQLDLQGAYQRYNLPGVLQTLAKLKGFRISEDAIRSGLENVMENTGLRGRWQQLGEKPTVICDTGHNQDGIRFIVEQLQRLSYKTLHIVWGMVKDKSADEVLTLLPKTAVYYFCAANIPRALPANELKEKAAAYKLIGESYASVGEAIRAARSNADNQDVVFIGGSTFVVAEIEDL
ncbi:MAG: bifunctional folylpolyglutamate synthase/dihydrofolate synthase [Cyclobacteriaceae bacterium]|nr:bifunctional folylpolyglutamate synthase/dihydrofolate synthase [Cyclobacteriaceae bacterium]